MEGECKPGDPVARPDASRGTVDAGRMELSYCQRCGTLRVHPAGGAGHICAACAKAIRWIYGEGER